MQVTLGEQEKALRKRLQELSHGVEANLRLGLRPDHADYRTWSDIEKTRSTLPHSGRYATTWRDYLHTIPLYLENRQARLRRVLDRRADAVKAEKRIFAVVIVVAISVMVASAFPCYWFLIVTPTVLLNTYARGSATELRDPKK